MIDNTCTAWRIDLIPGVGAGGINLNPEVRRPITVSNLGTGRDPDSDPDIEASPRLIAKSRANPSLPGGKAFQGRTANNRGIELDRQTPVFP